MSGYIYSVIYHDAQNDEVSLRFTSTRKYFLENWISKNYTEGLSFYRSRDGRPDSTVKLEYLDLVGYDPGEL
jgi:hypothetical protein